jgi:hypothetical protein
VSPELIRKLIEQKVIRENTEIDAYYKGVDIGGANIARVQGNFAIRGAKLKNNEVIFEVVSTQDGSPRKIPAQDIIRIDGMELERFANNYGMTLGGETVKQGKRRGRKPKAKVKVDA